MTRCMPNAAQRPLHDVLTCVREGVRPSLPAAGRRLEANAERHLKLARSEMARLFAACPKAIDAETLRFLDRGSTFALDDLRYHYPLEPVPEGWDPQDWLEKLVMDAAHARATVMILPRQGEGR